MPGRASCIPRYLGLVLPLQRKQTKKKKEEKREREKPRLLWYTYRPAVLLPCLLHLVTFSPLSTSLVPHYLLLLFSFSPRLVLRALETTGSQGKSLGLRVFCPNPEYIYSRSVYHPNIAWDRALLLDCCYCCCCSGHAPAPIDINHPRQPHPHPHHLAHTTLPPSTWP